MTQPVKIDAQRRIIFLSISFIFILLAILFSVLYVFSKFPERMLVEIPPRLPNESIVLGIGEKHPANAYAFAHYIFQQLMSCPTDCKDDYIRRIKAARHLGLISTTMYRDLLNNYNYRNDRRQLGGRTRSVGLVDVETYSADRVEQLGANWIVYLRLNIVEEKNEQPVRDVNMMFPIRLIKADIDTARNPWGYQLDGYAKAPFEVEVTIEDET